MPVDVHALNGLRLDGASPGLSRRPALPLDLRSEGPCGPVRVWSDVSLLELSRLLEPDGKLAPPGLVFARRWGLLHLPTAWRCGCGAPADCLRFEGRPPWVALLGLVPFRDPLPLCKACAQKPRQESTASQDGGAAS